VSEHFKSWFIDDMKHCSGDVYSYYESPLFGYLIKSSKQYDKRHSTNADAFREPEAERLGHETPTNDSAKSGCLNF
jgi:hypothetical protein